MDNNFEHFKKWFVWDEMVPYYKSIEEGFLSAHPDDTQFLVVFTAFPFPSASNKVVRSPSITGTGFDHWVTDFEQLKPGFFPAEKPLYSVSTSRIESLLRMNDWTQVYNKQKMSPDWYYLSYIFSQEFSHTWLAFPYYQTASGEVKKDMLGGELAHWSFYMNTYGSPMDGMDWKDNGDGTFTSADPDVFMFSDLDLYLMGLLPKNLVRPWFIIDNPRDCFFDETAVPCPNADHRPRSPTKYKISGTRRDITIEDVINFEGPRLPAAGTAPTTFSASFIVLKRPNEVMEESDKQAIEDLIDSIPPLWNKQTRGLSQIIIN